MVKVEYENADNREQLINEHVSSGLLLLEEQNITKGNFLIFATATEAEEYFMYIPTDKEIIGQQLVDLELQNLSFQNENQSLGQQLVGMDLRLLQGGM